MSADQPWTPPAGPQDAWTPAVRNPRALPPHLRPALPVVERDYFAFWRAPRYRWWKSLVALAMATFAFLLITGVAQFIGWGIDQADLSVLVRNELPPTGPGFFLANNVGLALMIPVAMLTQWASVQQRPKWLSSVEGGVRWRWLFIITGCILPIWIVVIAIQLAFSPMDEVGVRDHTLLMVVGILVTTPLQAAGEEYIVRGLLGRIVASWFGVPWLGFVISTAVTATVFMLLHGAGDPWLNAFYVVFALAGSWVTWRTGGLEAAVAIHVVNNVVSEAMLPFVDFSDMFDRSAGVGDPSILMNVGALLLAVGVVEVLMRRRRPVARTAPGRAELEALAAPRPMPGWGAPQAPGSW